MGLCVGATIAGVIRVWALRALVCEARVVTWAHVCWRVPACVCMWAPAVIAPEVIACDHVRVCWRVRAR